MCAVKAEIDPHGRLFTTAVTFEVKKKFYFTHTYKQGQDTHKYPYKLTTQLFKSDFCPFCDFRSSMVRLLSIQCIQCLMDAVPQYSPPAQKTATGHINTRAHSYVFMLMYWLTFIYCQTCTFIHVYVYTYAYTHTRPKALNMYTYTRTLSEAYTIRPIPVHTHAHTRRHSWCSVPLNSSNPSTSCSPNHSPRSNADIYPFPVFYREGFTHLFRCEASPHAAMKNEGLDPWGVYWFLRCPKTV